MFIIKFKQRSVLIIFDKFFCENMCKFIEIISGRHNEIQKETKCFQNILFIKGNYLDDEIFYPPLCKPENFLESIEKIKNYYKEKDKPYIIKALPDESPIDVQQIVDFIESHHFNPSEIRKTVENLTWKIQMKRVVDEA